jgi:hypothetical protein
MGDIRVDDAAEGSPVPTRRVPIHRPSQPTVTDAAVTLYARAKRLLRRPQTDAVHRELQAVSHELAVELKWKPWMVDVIDTIGFAGPSQWEGESWWQAAAVADELEQALRARRKAARMARSAA